MHMVIMYVILGCYIHNNIITCIISKINRMLHSYEVCTYVGNNSHKVTLAIYVVNLTSYVCNEGEIFLSKWQRHPSLE